ncbi:MAG: DUF424 family protein [Nanoarchaeota archaeon]|nr:DUF424 family protein [Nanoarchaeota archaeon]
MLVKIHKAEGRAIVAIADKDLIGKEFSEGEKYLNISKSFYKGEEKDEEEILKLLKDVNSVNAVGKESIKFCIKHELVEKGNRLANRK